MALYKKLALWCLLVGVGLLALIGMMVALVSVWTGVSHMKQNGFYVPITAGILLFIGMLIFFIRSTNRILTYLKDEEIFSP